MNHSTRTMNVTQPPPTNSPKDYLEYKIGESLLPIQMTFFLLLGTIGNVVSLIGFSTKKLCRSSSSVYLRCLSVVDTVTLWAYFFYMLQRVYIPSLASAVFCKAITFFTSTGSALSAWTITCMTVERFLAVRWPLRMSNVFTRQNTAVTEMFVTLFIVGLNLHYWWTVHVVYRPTSSLYVCGLDLSYAKFHQIWSYVDVIFGVFIPIFLVFTFNTLIILSLHTAKRTARLLTSNVHLRGRSSPVPTPCNGSSLHTGRTTSVLVLVSVSFLVLVTPYAICYVMIATGYFNISVSHQYAEAFLFQQLCLMCLMCNYSINGLLYAVSGTRFRAEVLVACHFQTRRMRWMKRSGTASMTQMTTLSTRSKLGHSGL